MRKILSSILLIVTIGCGENHTGDSGLGDAASREDNSYEVFEDLDSISILFSDKQFRKIAEKRARALYRGQLMSEAEDWVAAQIIYLGDTLKAEMRLKGDLYDHWGHEAHWSFKVNVKSGGVVMGMKRFAIQRPATRSFLNEWILHELLRYNDLIALKYDFVKLTLNGQPFPVYAVEENFDKRLIERNERREGLTFRFERGFFWYHDPGLNDAFYTCLIRPYQENKTLRTPVLRDQYTIVRNLIQGFRKGELKTSDVFDSKKLATGLALIDLTGHHHASALDNIKFYYNPITSLIEPILYDNQTFMDIKEQGLLGEHKSLGETKKVKQATLTNSYWYQHLFSDEIFFQDYIKALDRISQKEYLDQFISSIEKSSMDKIDMLHLTYPEYEFGGYNVLYSNQEYIQEILSTEFAPEDLPKSISEEKPIKSGSTITMKGIDKSQLPELARYFASLDLLGSEEISDGLKLLKSFSADAGSGDRKSLISQIKVKEHKSSIPSYEIFGVKDYADDEGYRILDNLFGSDDFMEMYIRALEEVSSPELFSSSAVHHRYDDLIAVFKRLGSADKEVIEKNQMYLWKYLNPVKAIHIHFESIDIEQERLFLRVTNAHKFPMEILEALAYKDWVFFPKQKRVIEGTRENELMKSEIVEFELQKRFATSLKTYGSLEVNFPWNKSMLKNLKVNYRIEGATRSRSEVVHPFQRLDPEFSKGDFIRGTTKLKGRKIVDLDEQNKTVTIHEGSWEVSSNIKIPKGYTFVIEKGASINLVNGAMILSNSPVEAIGSEDDPIHIQSTDGTGQGLSIIGAGALSKLKHISFSNLTSPSKNGWVLSGSVNFYESNVDIRDFYFSSNRCEDALNIIRSTYSLYEGTFSDIFADALDLDFSTGSVANVRFEQIGNDALDIAGGDTNHFSTIEIVTTGDKGISVGEGGIVVGENISISDAEISVAVKDRSNASFTELYLKDCRLGFAAFEKKSEYGGSKMKVQNVTLESVSTLYLLEHNSQLQIEEKNLAPNCDNVSKQLNGVTYGKSSKPSSSIRP